MKGKIMTDKIMTDKMINLTPDVVNIYDEDRKTLLATIQPSGQTARVEMTRCRAGTLFGGIPTYRSEVGDVTGIPEGRSLYIVSAMVRLALPKNYNIYSPGELLRDASGQPIGCIGLESN
jgi:hypothetical protein